MNILLLAATAASIASSEFNRYSAEICPSAKVRTEFRVDANGFTGETDAYRVRESDGKLVFTGRNDRSLLYAVYDYFRRYCGCAYFWDGDVVPKRDSLPVKGVCIDEQSRFEYRGCQYFAHRGLTRFQAEHWGFAEWKREIDWAVKNRLNLIMLRIGIEDLFQLAFPDVVPYPDVSVTEVPDAENGYNYRTPFWSLQYRHALRRKVMDYALERGLMYPAEYGTMTHWFSRTPKAFLEKMKPDPLPQVNDNYAEPSGFVWDIRQKKWCDAYWKLTEAAIDAYGYTGLLFTPGFDERVVFSNRADNVRFKIDVIEKFNREAARRHPDAKLLIEGWDFLFSWRPEEVVEFTKRADPSRTIVFDFTADSPGNARASAAIPRDNNFTQWGVTNRFPYVFGFMLEFNPGCDIRANYKLIREREKAIRNDPMCKGYVLWPEASHTDIFAWRYFTDMSWSLPETPVDELLTRFCRDRYGRQADAMRAIWRRVIPFSPKSGWGRRFADNLFERYGKMRNNAAFWKDEQRLTGTVPAAEIFAALAEIDWDGAFVRRDAIDLARTTLDRMLFDGFWHLMRAYHELGAKASASKVAAFEAQAFRYEQLLALFGDLLALHDDYSLTATLEAMDRTERLVNPRAEHLLYENAACEYCRSHHYELVRGLYQPIVAEICRTLVARAKAGDRSPLPAVTDFLQLLRETDHPIRAFRPDASRRTAARFREVMQALTCASGVCVPKLPASGSDEVVTKTLQAAIDETSASGGGVVRIPPGAWVTGELHLKSGVTLELQRGATLLGSTNIQDYVRKEVRCALILAEGVRDVGLKGFGTLDGRGGSFSHDHLRPYLVRFSGCTNVVCEDVSLRAGGAWTIFCLKCDGVIYRRLKIWSHVNYCNDGMDISSRNVLVEDCEIDSDDDGLALKTPTPDVVVENVEVRNCRIASSCNSIHLGTESWGTFRNVDIHDCQIVPPSACHRFDWRESALGATDEMIGLAGITVMCMDGEVMENVRIRNLTMKGPTTPLFIRCDRRHPERPGIPAKMDGVLIENVKAEAASRVASSITGVADLHPRNVVIRNFEVTAPGGGMLDECVFPVPECEGGIGAPSNLKFDYQALPAHGFYVRHVDSIRFENVRTRCLSRDDRPAIAFEDARVTVTDEAGLTPGASGLGRVYEITSENRRKMEERTWASYRRGEAYYRAVKQRTGGEAPLVVVLGVNERDRAFASSVIGQGRRRDLSVLMPFGRTVGAVLSALDSVTEKGSRRRVYLKGDRDMAALALELLATAPERFAGASVVALSKDVGAKLANVRGKALDIIVAARNPKQAQAGFAAFNALVDEENRVSDADVARVVRTGMIPAALFYDGPSDSDFPAPNRRLVFRRQVGNVRFSVTSDRDVSAFDPSFRWIVSRETRLFLK